MGAPLQDPELFPYGLPLFHAIAWIYFFCVSSNAQDRFNENAKNMLMDDAVLEYTLLFFDNPSSPQRYDKLHDNFRCNTESNGITGIYRW